MFFFFLISNKFIDIKKGSTLVHRECTRGQNNQEQWCFKKLYIEKVQLQTAETNELLILFFLKL